MENDYSYQHGRINPGVEENFDLVESITVEKQQDEQLRQRNDRMGLSDDELVCMRLSDAGIVSMTQFRTDAQAGMWILYFSYEWGCSTVNID